MRKSLGTVAVIAPSFAVPPEPFELGLARLRRMGFQVRVGEHVLAQDGYLAGNDDQRIEDLIRFWTDPEIDLIWLARGGYGSARLLDRLPWRKLRNRPKRWVGYSDATALFSAALRLPGQVCLHGPVVTELADRRLWHGPSLRDALRNKKFSIRFRKADVVSEGKASGRLVGGNLTVLAHLCGTGYEPPVDGAILFLEDIGEQIYSLDRALVQLRQAGWLDRIQGVILGHFGTLPRRKFPPDRRWGEVVQEFFGPLGVPVVSGIAAGHVAGKRTLPLGWTATLDSDKRTLILTP